MVVVTGFIKKLTRGHYKHKMQTRVTCINCLHWWQGCGEVIIPYKHRLQSATCRDICSFLGCTKKLNLSESKKGNNSHIMPTRSICNNWLHLWGGYGEVIGSYKQYMQRYKLISRVYKKPLNKTSKSKQGHNRARLCQCGVKSEELPSRVFCSSSTWLISLCFSSSSSALTSDSSAENIQVHTPR